MSASRLNPVVPISYPFGCDWNEYFRRFFDEPSSEKVGQLEGIMRHLSVNGLGSAPCPCSLARPSCLLSRQLSSSMSSPAATNVQSDNKLFQVMVDVKQFAPEEIEVKTIDNFIVVQGKHDDKVDEHGLISRQFTRRYTVPDDYDPLFVTSTLSEDGILTIKVPKKVVPGSPSERVVPITLQPGRALSGIHEPTSTISNEEEVIDKQGEDEQHSSITHETV